MLDFLTKNIELIKNIASIIAAIFSIVGVVYSFLINQKVEKIKNKILFNTRLNELLDKLKNHSKRLNELLDNYQNSIREIRKELTEAIVTFENIASKLSTNEKKEIQKLISLIKQIIKNIQVGDNLKISYFRFFNRKIVSEDDIWRIFEEISASITRIDNLMKDVNAIIKHS